MSSPEKEPFQTLPSFTFLLFWASSGNMSLRGLSWKLKTCCLMLRVNTPPSGAPTQGSPHRVEQTVPCAHGLRRDSGQATPTQRPTRDFSTLSLGSHSPPGEASCTQQQGAPPLTHDPLRSHSRPWSSLRAKQPYPQPRSQPSGWKDSRVLMLNARCTKAP